MNQRMYGLGSKRSVIREIFEFGRQRAQEVGAENVFDFSLGNPSVEPPRQVEEVLVQLISESSPTALHGYTSAQGDLSVRRAISDYIQKTHSVPCDPDYIYMTCGAAASLVISLSALCEEGDEVISFAPYFTEYKVFSETAGAKLIALPSDPQTFQIDFSLLEQAIGSRTAAVLINSPNNPSGVVYNEDTVKKLADLLRKKSAQLGRTIYLVTDEPYRELVYGGVKVPYLTAYYKDTLVCYSYSKSLSLPGERIGYIFVNPQAEKAKEIYLAVCGAGRAHGYVCAPSLFQKMIARCRGSLRMSLSMRGTGTRSSERCAGTDFPAYSRTERSICLCALPNPMQTPSVSGQKNTICSLSPGAISAAPDMCGSPIASRRR